MTSLNHYLRQTD